MKLKLGAVLMLAGCLSQVASSDEGSAAKSEFYVNPGIALTGAGAQGYKNSFSLDAGYLKAVHPIASIGWELGYLFSSKNETDTYTTDTSAKVLHLGPEIKLGPTFMVSGMDVNPYVAGGGGLYWTHQNKGTLTRANGTTAAVDSYDRTNGGWNIGAGVSVALPGNWSIGFDLRRHDIVNKHVSDFTWVTPAFRFALQFS